MISPTHGKLTMEEVAKKIIDFVGNKDRHQEIEITIGTDSQNFDKTKIVAVVVVRRVGNGGIFFYQVTHHRKINSIREKLYIETNISLKLADELLTVIQEMGAMKDELLNDQMYINGNKVNLGIHVDAGYNGPTKQLITEITGWVKACGFNVEIKPNSYAASCIADKYSK